MERIIYLFICFCTVTITSCEKDNMSTNDENIISSISVGKINGKDVAMAATFPLCGSGGSNQIVRGGSLRDNYYSELGITFDNFGSFSTVFLGKFDKVPDTFSSKTTSSYRIIDEYLRQGGLISEKVYFSAKLLIDGILFVTLKGNYFEGTVDVIDSNRVEEFGFEILTTEEEICPSSNILVVKSTWSYSGYIYNENDFSDSIQITDLKIHLNNHGY